MFKRILLVALALGVLAFTLCYTFPMNGEEEDDYIDSRIIQDGTLFGPAPNLFKNKKTKENSNGAVESKESNLKSAESVLESKKINLQKELNDTKPIMDVKSDHVDDENNFTFESGPAKILKFKNDVTPNGFEFSYLTSHGIRRAEKGYLTDDKWLIKGYILSSLKNGSSTLLLYVADENGYRTKFDRNSTVTVNTVEDYVGWNEDPEEHRIGGGALNALIRG